MRAQPRVDVETDSVRVGRRVDRGARRCDRKLRDLVELDEELWRREPLVRSVVQLRARESGASGARVGGSGQCWTMGGEGTAGG